MGQEIGLEQKQTLNLTPQMRQSIRILQMNMAELSDWLEEESQRNPVLEVELDGHFEKKDNNNKETDHYSFFSEWTEIGKNSILPMGKGEEKQFIFSQNTTLYDHLLLCLRIVVKDEIDFKIGEYLIGNMNQNGYLVTSCLEVAIDLNIPEKRIKQVLAMIQNGSTIPGLGARNLKECLLIQLKYLKLEEKDILKKLISSYLKELSERKFKKICKALHLSLYDVQNLLDVLIRNFDPKPGRVFYPDNEVNFLTPDIIVKNINSQYEIIENKGFIPSIKINPVYKNMLIGTKSGGDVKNREIFLNEGQIEHEKTLDYLKRKMDQAKWIIHCVEKRKRTLFDITKFIIHYQEEFLEKGIAYLKPLSMKILADSLGYHESTISRAVSGKKIQIPRGFYDLKFFFSKSLPQNYEEEVSNERIKNLLKKHILMEDPYHPYSDQKLSEIFRIKEKISVARRTITKYRKLLNISHSKIRRKYKKIGK